ncbi:MAG: hypothetical protein M1823_004866 [Watsoniomyces obsoletus]|nr:MAG: hypothetical protein M1823_004866 [Watsoniomyces obsoletus]
MSNPGTPSPRLGDPWSAAGADISRSRGTSPRREYTQSNGTPKTVSWAPAISSNQNMNGPSSSWSGRSDFFGRHYRRLSDSLPRFQRSGRGRDYAEKEKLGRGRWVPANGSLRGNLLSMCGRILRRLRLRFVIVLAFLFAIFLFYVTPLHHLYRSAGYLGGGSKFVIILAANQGGGVMEWKGPREWAIERDSIKNKRKYVKKWGYNLEIVDMTTKKRYAHEWRESWEKVDEIRNAMRKYPKAEWFWWLDLHTFIMEPSYSLQSHIFNHLKEVTYRNINEYNPLNITHPFPAPHIDELSGSLEGDGKPESINLIVPQDCGGFNLGSFFVRRSDWSDRLLDIWWDPAGYEQKHMEWEHKEQDALEYLYKNQAWIRPHTAFIPQRMINSFPPGACSDAPNGSMIHYVEHDRDFVVNMAGCEWGRDCWGEMYRYRELSNHLNRTWWEKFKDALSERWKLIKKARQKS